MLSGFRAGVERGRGTATDDATDATAHTDPGGSPLENEGPST
jgi:hypothetical protein